MTFGKIVVKTCLVKNKEMEMEAKNRSAYNITQVDFLCQLSSLWCNCYCYWLQCVIKYKELLWWLLLLQLCSKLTLLKHFEDIKQFSCRSRPRRGVVSCCAWPWTHVKFCLRYVLHLPHSLYEIGTLVLHSHSLSHIYSFFYVHLFECSLSARCFLQQ